MVDDARRSGEDRLQFRELNLGIVVVAALKASELVAIWQQVPLAFATSFEKNLQSSLQEPTPPPLPDSKSGQPRIAIVGGLTGLLRKTVWTVVVYFSLYTHFESL